MKAAIIGGGVIGGGWAARFLLSGWDVALFDPDPDCARKINEVLANARRSLPALYDTALPAEGQLSFAANLSEAVAGADWVQESVPERIAIKHEVLNELTVRVGPETVIGSSTSGFKPSELQAGIARPAQLVVTHPFNPVYLLPLVEVVPSAATAPAVVERCHEILTEIGMKPLLIRKEIDAHIADRLLEAIWREALWLINDGIATTEEIDDAIRFGFGLRWAQMGLFETYRIAGGEAGMRHFIGQFGPALQWPWTKLTDVPELTDALVDRIVQQSDAQSGDYTTWELERIRDDNLVAILRALKKTGWAAGTTLRDQEKTLPTPAEQENGPVVTVDRQVPSSWADYNGHMNETHYLEVFSQASDRFMILIGADADYVAAGKSYFTVESHLRHLGEVKAGERIGVTTQVISGRGKKLHVFHRLITADGRLVATGEHLLVHVDLQTRRSCAPEASVAGRLSRFSDNHAKLSLPEGSGRCVGQKD